MARDKPGVLGAIASVLGRHGLSIASVIQKGRGPAQTVPVIMRTHDAPERNLKRALAEIRSEENRALGPRVYPNRGEALGDGVGHQAAIQTTAVVLLARTDRALPALPAGDGLTPVVTLNEGNTPLIEVRALAERLGPNIKVYLKFEGANPTGSFKDRGMTLAISKALGRGRARGNLRLDRQHRGVGGGLRGPRGPEGLRADSKRRGGAGQAVAKRDAWRAGARGDRQLRHLFEPGARSCGARSGQDSAGQQCQPRSNRGAENGGVRDLRSTGRRADASFSAGRQRRQYHGLLGRLPGI